MSGIASRFGTLYGSSIWSPHATSGAKHRGGKSHKVHAVRAGVVLGNLFTAGLVNIGFAAHFARAQRSESHAKVLSSRCTQAARALASDYHLTRAKMAYLLKDQLGLHKQMGNHEKEAGADLTHADREQWQAFLADHGAKLKKFVKQTAKGH